MTCPHCQYELRDDALFCSNCGRPVVRAGDGAETKLDVGGDDATIVRGVAPVGNQHYATTRRLSESGDADPLLGRVLDKRYQLIGHLGHGGMGTVYRARRLALGDDVAVKVLHREFVAQPAMIDRFRREARAAAMLHHPNIVAIYDFGDAADDTNDLREAIPAYIVMELLRGETLGAMLKRDGRLEPSRAVRLLRAACEGVGAAHRRGIVHRDLKPDNIIVLPVDTDNALRSDDTHGDDAEAARETVKVVDFGIAKLRDMTGEAAHDQTLTQVGMMLGTPSYMSPEQCRGESLDARSDVYSLGAILYELLAGRVPFTAPTAQGVIAKHLTDTVPPLPLTGYADASDAALVGRLEAVIRRAMAKEPDARQADAAQFAREMIAALRGAKTSDAPPLFTGTPVPVQPIPQFAADIIEQEESEPPAPRSSNFGKFIGLTLIAVVAAGLSALAWLLWMGGNTGVNNRNVNRNVNVRPRATPTPRVEATPTPTPTFDPANVNGEIVVPSPDGNVNGEPAFGATGNLPFDPASVANQVQATINGWVETTRDRDLDGQMNYYAPELENFYRQPRADSATVRARLEQAFDRYDDLDIRISNLRIQLDGTGQRATAVFDKQWRFEGASVSRGAVQQELQLTKSGDRWLIVGERDLRVYPGGEIPR